MQAFKIDNFRRAHPESSFPLVTSVDSATRQVLRDSIRGNLGIEAFDDLAFVKEIPRRSSVVSGMLATDEGFRLTAVLHRLLIVSAPRIYVNWYRFDDVDEFRLVDFDQFFSDIWYPGADDIDVFDQTCEWLVSVNHSGDISFLNGESLRDSRRLGQGGGLASS